MNIAIIGAGIAGLTAGYRLQQAGHRVEVLEAAPRPGGRMGSRTIDGFQIDLGVHMLLEHYDRTRALIEELGLADQWFELESGDGGVLRDRGLLRFSPKHVFDVLRFRGIAWPSRVRLFLELARAWRLRDDLDFFDLSIGDDALDAEDCESFARRRLGSEATDYVVDAFIRTFHFHGAHKMSVKYFDALAALLATRGELRSFALRRHMGALPDALAARLDVRYETAVASVVGRAGDVCVSWPGGQGRYDAAVVATTAGVARRLLEDASPAQRELLEHAQSSSTIVCSFTVPLHVAADFEGIWVPFVESPIVCAVSNETCKGSADGQRCVFNVFLHEEAAQIWLHRTDREIEDEVVREVSRLFPRYMGRLTPLFVQRWPEALPVYGVGQVTRVKAFWARGQGERRVWLCGDYLNHPWVEGAVRCGEKVAACLA